MNISCFFSSFIFLTNVINNYLKNEFTYAMIFFCLFTTSIIFHYSKTFYSNLFDKLSIMMVVCYGGFVYYKKMINVTEMNWIHYVPLFCFCLTIYLYGYGYLTDSYCFVNDCELGNIYHSLLHITSSVGHHAIVMI
jgi:hypothetical protein